MKIEFDPEKDLVNRAKHGVSLALAERIDLSEAVVLSDQRFDYGETRLVAYAMLDDRLHAMTFTFRGESVRVINLRKANRRERLRYGRS